MQHPNKNDLLSIYYNEKIKPGDKETILSHVDTCQTCQNYIKTLHRVEDMLTIWQDEKPVPQVLDKIMENISATQTKPVQSRQFISIMPILQIAFSICFILALLYIIQSKIVLSPIWQTINQFWFVETFGSFGVTMISFFILGTFITLSLTPILLFDSQKIRI
jgi:hypothetical protein